MPSAVTDRFQRFGHRNDRLDDCRVFRIVANALDERTVDLEDIERQALQIGQRGITSPEVVDRQLNAELPELPERFDGEFDVTHDDAFGDLQLEPAGRHAGRAQRARHPFDQIRFLKLARRQVHARHQRLVAREFRLPGDQLPAGLFQHPLPDRNNQTRLLGNDDKFRGRQKAARRMPPTHQRFDRGHPIRVQIDNRLIMHDQFAALDRLPQIVLEI